MALRHTNHSGSVTEHHTMEPLETLLNTTRQHGIPVFISPHDSYPTDQGWQFEGARR
jgi:hypothetical protein